MNLKTKNKNDQLFDILNFLFFTICLIAVMYPLYFIIIASVSDPYDVSGGKVFLWPSGFNLEGYKRVFSTDTILIGYRNSLFYVLLGTSINLFFTLPPAYALSKKDLAFKRPLMIFLLIPMYFSGGLIPTYILVKDIGFINTIWALVIPGAIGIWNVIVSKSFFQATIPDELVDAAAVDGCSNTRFFLSVAIPLSKALIAVQILFYGLGHWNSWFGAMIYISDKNLYPLQLVLRNILIMDDPVLEMIKDQNEIAKREKLAETLKYASIIVSSVPVLIIYPSLQKYFAKGVMIGSIKG